DGTYAGKNMGELLVSKGDTGYVTRIDMFLQRFYIYAVHFVETDRKVGMRAKELCTLDYLPDHVLARAGHGLFARISLPAGISVGKMPRRSGRSPQPWRISRPGRR
ncbi:nitrogen fixation protein NifZ, partial [Paraburkholderia sabiae]